jgi:hypothetical protein
MHAHAAAAADQVDLRSHNMLSLVGDSRLSDVLLLLLLLYRGLPLMGQRVVIIIDQ